jgi:hypothetical protein
MSDIGIINNMRQYELEKVRLIFCGGANGIIG